MPFQNELLYETNCLYSKVFCYVSVSKVQPKCTFLARRAVVVAKEDFPIVGSGMYTRVKDALHAITYSTINLSQYRS